MAGRTDQPVKNKHHFIMPTFCFLRCKFFSGPPGPVLWARRSYDTLVLSLKNVAEGIRYITTRKENVFEANILCLALPSHTGVLIFFVCSSKGPPGPSASWWLRNCVSLNFGSNLKSKKSYLLNPTLWIIILRLENSQRPQGCFGWFWPKRQNVSRTYTFTSIDLKIWELMTIFILNGVSEVAFFMKML